MKQRDIGIVAHFKMATYQIKIIMNNYWKPRYPVGSLLLLGMCLIISKPAASQDEALKIRTQATARNEIDKKEAPSRSRRARAKRRELRAARQDIRIERRHLRKKANVTKFIRRREGRYVREIVYDFDKKCFTDGVHEGGLIRKSPRESSYHLNNPPYEIDELDGVQLRIKNVNPFSYSVNLYELQGDQISNEELTKGSGSLSLKLENEPFKFLSIPVEKLTIANANVEEGLAKINSIETVLKDIQASRKEIDQIARDNTNYETKAVRADSLNYWKTKIEINSSRTKEIVARIKTFKDSTELKVELINERLQLTNLKNATAPLEVALRKQLEELRISVDKLNLFVLLDKEIVVQAKSSGNEFQKLDESVKKLIFNVAESSDLDVLPIKYSALRESILALIANCNSDIANLIKLNTTGDKDKNSIYYEIKNRLDIFSIQFEGFDHIGFVSHLISICNKIRRENFEMVYETLSIAENADFIKYRIEFKPNEVLGTISSPNPFNLELALQIHEGLKIDVSTCVVLDWGLADASYYFDKKTVSSKEYAFVRKNPDKGEITPSISAMLNAYKRGSTNFKWGASIGFGVSNNLRARLYAGPSIIIGRKERILVSTGIAFGATSRLANGYKETSDDDFKSSLIEDAYEVNSSLPSEVPTVVDLYKFGWYFAVGFNLSGKDNKSFLENIKFK